MKDFACTCVCLDTGGAGTGEIAGDGAIGRYYAIAFVSEDLSDSHIGVLAI